MFAGEQVTNGVPGLTNCDPGDFHGSARIRFLPTGLYFSLLTMIYVRTALIATSIKYVASSALQCEPPAPRADRNHLLGGFHRRRNTMRLESYCCCSRFCSCSPARCSRKAPERVSRPTSCDSLAAAIGMAIASGLCGLARVRPSPAPLRRSRGIPALARASGRAGARLGVDRIAGDVHLVIIFVK